MDWDNDALRYHGFSKLSRRRCYRPVLYLNGTQHYFGECETRVEAARAYDQLLRFFLPFTPSRAMPNFPKDFFGFTKDSVLAYEGHGLVSTKKMLALEERLTQDFEVLGRSVNDYELRRQQEIRVFRDAPDLATVAFIAAKKRAFQKLEDLTVQIKRVNGDLSGLCLDQIMKDIALPDSSSLLVADARAGFETMKKTIEAVNVAANNFLANLKAAVGEL